MGIRELLRKYRKGGDPSSCLTISEKQNAPQQQKQSTCIQSIDLKALPYV